MLISHAQATLIFEGEGFALHLAPDNHFVFYPKEQAQLLKFSGEYLQRNDSLILTTHKLDGERAILAIYQSSQWQLEQSYAQEDFHQLLPTQLHISLELYPNGNPKMEYYWEDVQEKTFQVYAFSPEKWIVNISQYKKGRKEGKELIFFENEKGVIHQELHYAQGELSGKSYTYEALNDDYLEVRLVQIEVYKVGRLIKSKKPAAPPVFYTSHF